MRSGTKSGFTLVEMLVTIAILAVAAAIAVPVYRSYVAEARIASAITDIRQIELILSDLYLDNNPPATLAAAGVDLVDPWGNPYRYLWLRGNPDPSVNGKRRRDRAMNPVNSDYDLYSMGPDGETAPQFTAARGRDDIARANDGGFVGVSGRTSILAKGT